MVKESLVCIICPKACNLEIELEGREVKSVTGHQCKRGVAYAEKEFINPERELASTVIIKNGVLPLLPVRSSRALPKDSLLKAMEIINKTEVNAPVKVGDLIIENILDTDVDIIASRNMDSIK